MNKQLQRSRDEKVIGGVCGGLAEYFAVDSTLVRVLFVVATLLGPGAILYAVLWAVMPLAPPPPPAA
jgi:phage shock protein C